MMKKGQESELMHELNRLVEYARYDLSSPTVVHGAEYGV